MPKSADYPVIMHGAAYHIARKLEGAAPAALSFSDLTKDYKHSMPSDLHRVRRHEKLADDRAAEAWVIRYAVELLDGGLTVDGDMVSFAPGKSYDDLRIFGEPIGRPGPDPYAKLRDPFSPVSGQFATNIREEIGDLTELRESMQTWGWIPEFPALLDERNVILVGNRRMKVAKELGIEPVTKTLVLGNGDAADAERFKLAVASNLGGKKLSPNDRKRIATHLYSDHNWTMKRIGEALDVGKSTVARDIEGFPTVGKPHRPKGGRPKGSKTGKKTFASKAETIASTKAELDRKIEPLIEQGVSRNAIAETLKVPERVVRDAQERYVGRVQVRMEKAEQSCTCPICGHIHMHTPVK
jgi:ParB-like chromosome segregation protein Spo0J